MFEEEERFLRYLYVMAERYEENGRRPTKERYFEKAYAIDNALRFDKRMGDKHQGCARALLYKWGLLKPNE